MDIHSQEIVRPDASRSNEGVHVVRARDKLSGGDVFARTAKELTVRESNSLLEQFNLHRTLRHSGVVDAHDLILSNGKVTGFTLPVVDGHSLADCLHALQPHEVLAVLRDVAFATFGIHSLGYIHGDLSANNVWCVPGPTGIAGTLLDLGFAVRIGARLATEVQGTPGYISPEAFSSKPLGPASDAYSFGKLIEFCLECRSELQFRDILAQISGRCTQETEGDRLSDFAYLYASVVQMGRAAIGTEFGHSQFALPLRPAGLESKTKTLVEELQMAAIPDLFWITGEPGIGKSELIRHACHILQRRGLSTVRISANDRNEPIVDLDSMPFASMQRGPDVIFVELPGGTPLDSITIRSLGDQARRFSAKLVIESQVDPPASVRPARITHCKPLSFRQCMHASSHLLRNPGITAPNTEAAFATSRGNPARLRQVMTQYLVSGRRNRGEPLDFNRNSIGACEDVAASNPTQSKERSARGSYVKLNDYREAALAALHEWRDNRIAHNAPSVLVAHRLSDLFGKLGSLARQSRWQKIGLSHFDESKTGVLTEAELVAGIEILAIASPPREVVNRLTILQASDARMPRRVRFLTRSELGRAYLLMRDAKDAIPVLHEAKALCSGYDIANEYEAMILTRLGAAKMLATENQAARDYFTQAVRIAQTNGDWRMIARVQGNLGFLEQHCGEPGVAREWIRRQTRANLTHCRYSEYLSGLLNLTNCLVDLGEGTAAERRARIALALADVLSDKMLLGYAQNNLGWILTMRCESKMALELLRESLHIRESTGDIESMAQTHLNFARLNLSACAYDRALHSISEGQRYFEFVHSREGLRDCQRLLAKRLILLEEYEAAILMLDEVLTDADTDPVKDITDALLLRTEALLWLSRPDDAEKTLEATNLKPVHLKVHPLRARHLVLTGFLAMHRGELEAAYRQMKTGISMMMESRRTDLLLEAMTIMAVLADRMSNPLIGLRYLDHVAKTTARLREELR